MNSKSRRFFEKVISGKADHSIRYNDFYNLIININLGFVFESQDGTSHAQFYHPEYDVHMNIQSTKDGNAKPYQIKQLRVLIQKYKMR